MAFNDYYFARVKIHLVWPLGNIASCSRKLPITKHLYKLKEHKTLSYSINILLLKNVRLTKKVESRRQPLKMLKRLFHSRHYNFLTNSTNLCFHSWQQAFFRFFLNLFKKPALFWFGLNPDPSLFFHLTARLRAYPM